MNSEGHITYSAKIDEEFVDLLITLLYDNDDWRKISAIKKLKEFKILIEKEKELMKNEF